MMTRFTEDAATAQSLCGLPAEPLYRIRRLFDEVSRTIVLYFEVKRGIAYVAQTYVRSVDESRYVSVADLVPAEVRLEADVGVGSPILLCESQLLCIVNRYNSVEGSRAHVTASFLALVAVDLRTRASEVWNVCDGRIVNCVELVGGAEKDKEFYAIVGCSTQEVGGYRVDYFLAHMNWYSRAIANVAELKNVFY